LDAVSRQAEDASQELTAKGVEALLEHLAEIPCKSFPALGVGENQRFKAEDVVGSALVADEVCAHLSAFPCKGDEPPQTERPSRRRWPFGRRSR
jgi:hypothetical protein